MGKRLQKKMGLLLLLIGLVFAQPIQGNAQQGNDETLAVKERLEELIGTQQDAGTRYAAILQEYASTEKKIELSSAMQQNEEVLLAIKNFETEYLIHRLLSKNITINGDTGIDKNKVSVVGAVFNVSESDSAASIIFRKPSQDSIKQPLQGYDSNSIQFSITVWSGDTKKEILEFPITITMPVPDGIDPAKMKIIHYFSNDQYQIIEPRINQDNTCTFTITHLSEFVFAQTSPKPEPKPEKDDNNPLIEKKKVEDNADSIVDEVLSSLDAFRFSLKGCEKVEYTVEGNIPFFLIIKNEVQGQKFYDSISTILNGATLVRSYSFLPNGQRIYNIDEKITVTLKLNQDLQKEDRTWVLFGVLEDGTPYILEDLDKNDETITVSTNTFYAFALGYKAE